MTASGGDAGATAHQRLLRQAAEQLRRRDAALEAIEREVCPGCRQAVRRIAHRELAGGGADS